MPTQSIKSEIIEYKVNEAIREMKFIEDVRRPDQADDEIDEKMDDLLDDVIAIYSFRRGDELHVPKSIEWRNNVLCSFDDKRFLHMIRVTKDEFARLVNLVKDDTSFTTQGSALQLPVDIQLAIVLYRLGSSGGSASVRKLATLFGVGDGGTLAKITERVFGVILKKLPEYVYWPDAEERQQLVSQTFHELPHCIGYIDGSEIKLAEKPKNKHEVYYSRQRIYSVKLQVVCDHKMRIRDAVVGSPGSYHDSKIFTNSKIAKTKDHFFSGDQWIAGDSAYTLSKFLITPYRSNSHHMDVEKQTEFNTRHSKYRVRVENCFGILKDKFWSLKEMRVRINDARSQAFFCKWVLVCCVLHNILLEDHNIGSENGDMLDLEEGANSIDAQTPEHKRQALYNLMFD